MMNFVALSFISDIDNLMLNSRAFRTCFATEEDGLRSFFRSELRVRMSVQGWCRNGEAPCSAQTFAAVNALVFFACACTSPINYYASRRFLSWGDLLRMVPGAAAVLLAINLAL